MLGFVFVLSIITALTLNKGGLIYVTEEAEDAKLKVVVEHTAGQESTSYACFSIHSRPLQKCEDIYLNDLIISPSTPGQPRFPIFLQVLS